MKLIVVNKLGDYSGGSRHVREVTKRLTKYFDVVYVPYADVYTEDGSIDDLKKLEGIFKIPSEAYKERKFKPLLFPRSAKFYKEYVDEFDIYGDFIYDPDFVTPEAVFLSNKLDVSLGATLHEPIYSLSQSISYTYYSLKPFVYRSIDYLLGRTYWLYAISRSKVKFLKRAKYIKFIAGVSKGTLDSIKLRNVRKVLLNPPNGVDYYLDHESEKDDYIIFWTTLIPSKGIFNLINILNILKQKGVRIKLKVAGKFLYPRFERLFFDYIKKKKLDVEYLGFIKEDHKLREIIERAKLLVYPSLADGFSLVILESLALGTPVIAYSIPTVYSAFNTLPAVRFVRPGDINTFATQIERSLKDEEFLRSPFEDSVREFVKFHTWDNVAEGIAKIIKESV
ncbi:glycosyl transferase [Candidatus Acidianus copahuensis]|uniref:Glycosyl transferase n=1 Tax=Candidatus Acidianus copahuensis TaxID=1160895 RepID=A0A031LW15_9CREN|nr:glycosyltransferase [Candidatus Acidianus copahuensis]EZQ11343.1 glycosyl transferase [Candidatus Acidianus copahuensis]